MLKVPLTALCYRLGSRVVLWGGGGTSRRWDQVGESEVIRHLPLEGSFHQRRWLQKPVLGPNSPSKPMLLALPSLSSWLRRLSYLRLEAPTLWAKDSFCPHEVQCLRYFIVGGKKKVNIVPFPFYSSTVILASAKAHPTDKNIHF